MSVLRFQISEISAGRTTVSASLNTLYQTDLGQKFVRYFIVGGICAVVDWVIFSIFLYGPEFHYLLAATISFVVATALNYVLALRYVFERGKRARHTLIMMVYFVSGLSVIINLVILSAAIELFGIHALVAKILGTGSAFIWNFGARYLWIFRT